MRRWIAICMVVLLVALPITAQAAEISSKLFAPAKEALSLISYGEHKKALKKLGLGTGSSAVKALKKFAQEELSELEWITPQTDVAVGYQSGKNYKLAVPLESPSDGSVTALVLLSEDGKAFSGYSAMSWSDVKAGVADSSSVTWNKEYSPGDPVIVADSN